VDEVPGAIVECDTAYGGSRTQTAMHYQVAKDHGFTDISDFQILDEAGSITFPVSGGSRLTENYFSQREPQSAATVCTGDSSPQPR